MAAGADGVVYREEKLFSVLRGGIALEAEPDVVPGIVFVGIIAHGDIGRNKKAVSLRELVSFTVHIKVSVPEEIKQTSESLKGWPLEIWPEYDPNMKFGNLPSGTIAAYEYKFSHGGNDYHSFQILGVTSGLFQSGYVFTYTALEGEYNDHIEEVMKIISKVEF